MWSKGYYPFDWTSGDKRTHNCKSSQLVKRTSSQNVTTLATEDGDKFLRPVNTDAIDEHFVKKKQKEELDKSQTKNDLGKNERLGGLKTQKGDPGKN